MEVINTLQGLTIKKQNLDSFITEFEKVVSSSITEEQQIAEIEVDLEIDINEITPKLYRIIKQFAPFGPKTEFQILSVEM